MLIRPLLPALLLLTHCGASTPEPTASGGAGAGAEFGGNAGTLSVGGSVSAAGTQAASGTPAAAGEGSGGSGGSGGGGGGSNGGGASAGNGGVTGGGSGGDARPTNRESSIPVGIENVNDSPLKSASYRALLRFVPDATITIDRFYFGFKLRGASCWDSGNAGYGAGDGGTLHASLVDIDEATGLPTTELVGETVNGCTRHEEAAEFVGSDPVMVWVNTPATLQAGKLYALIVSNTHPQPANNFFSFNMPLADTALAGPHAKNELDQNASGGILGLDPREHVAWSQDAGKTWEYGSLNGQYRSYMNDHDTAHPATRMPQYGFRLANGEMLGVQPYYAYSTDCASCSVTYANARQARGFVELGGFTASGTNVGTLSIKNETTGKELSCTPPQGYGFRTCALPEPLSVGIGESYTVSTTGSVEVMELDNPQRLMFPGVGTAQGELRMYQKKPAAGTNAKDVPNLWAMPAN
ncbi:MAG TPA: hypothetical protein VHM25_08435 [Polyangiaceae bacterium]|nr:hypothetical protein [Polyangiaceae bacterium]